MTAGELKSFSYADFIGEWEDDGAQNAITALQESIEAAVRGPLGRALEACAHTLFEWGHALEEMTSELDPTGFSWLCSRVEGAPRLRITLDYLATVGFEVPTSNHLDHHAVQCIRACFRAVCDGPFARDEVERLTGVTPERLQGAASTWPACELPADEALDVAVCVLAMLLLYPVTPVADLESVVGASAAELRQLLETLPGANLDPWLEPGDVEQESAALLPRQAPEETTRFVEEEFRYPNFVVAWRRGRTETLEEELQRALGDEVRGAVVRSLEATIEQLREGGHALEEEPSSPDDFSWVATSALGAPRLRVALNYYVSVRFEGPLASNADAALVLTHLDEDAARLVRRCLREACGSLLPRWLCASLMPGCSFEQVELASHLWPRSGLSPSDTLQLAVEVLTVLFRDPEIDLRMLEQVVEASEEELRELLVRLTRARLN